MAGDIHEKPHPTARAAETTELHRELQDAGLRVHEHLAGHQTSGDKNLSPLEKSYMSYLETTKNFAKVEDLAKNGSPEEIMAFMKANEEKMASIIAGRTNTQQALLNTSDKENYSGKVLPNLEFT